MYAKRNDYIILGYDLTKDRPAIYNEWANNVKNKELWEEHQEKGEIQLFSDPSDNHHLFFGYIVAKRTNPDEAILCEISMEDMKRMKFFCVTPCRREPAGSIQKYRRCSGSYYGGTDD